MGKILVNDNYQISLEDKNIILQKKVFNINKETGEQYISWKNYGYYGRWDSLFNALTRLFIVEKVDKKTDINISELKLIFKETKNEITEILKDLEEKK